MEALGNDLYDIIVQIQPELAPKLTGMLLSMGEEECIACLESQERLAERLDEAFRVLDVNGQCAAAPQPEEKRVDPEDGQARTFNELRALCAGRYSAKEIEEYWHMCKPVGAKPAGKSQPAPQAKKTAPVKVKEAEVDVPEGPMVLGIDSGDVVPGLAFWLRELKLSQYVDNAVKWVEDQGACNLDEIVENLEDFADTLNLKKLERKRLEQGAKAAAEAAKDAMPEPEPETVVVVDRSKQERDEVLREHEQLTRELEELQAQPEDTGQRGAATSVAAARVKAPTVHVAPKAPAPSHYEVERNRESEKRERDYQKKQEAMQKARELEQNAQAAEEKRQHRHREMEERQQRAAAEIAARVAAASPTTGSAAGGADTGAGDVVEDFPSLGAGAWKPAAGGKKGRAKR